MPISIDWKNKIIFVPKTESLQIQSSPTEIRQLDLDVFRLALKNLEDDAEGMTFLDTHRHVPPVTVGGVTLARVVEIINGYTVTFEDGQYAINLVGANSNVGDVTNVNQVSVRSANSAGLTDISSLQAGSFNEGVAVDINSIYTGTNFPMGTRGFPVNNMTDAVSIANIRGLKKIFVINNMALTEGDYSQNKFIFVGNSIHTSLFLGPNVNVEFCEFQNLTISGSIDNGALIRESVVANMNIYNGTFFTCAVFGPVYISGNQQCTFLNCYSVSPSAVTVDYSSASNGMISIIRGWSGDLNIENCSTTCLSDIGLITGDLTLSSSNTSGIFNVYENSNLIDNSTATVNDRTTYKRVTERTWNTSLENIASDSFGEKIIKNLPK